MGWKLIENNLPGCGQ